MIFFRNWFPSNAFKKYRRKPHLHRKKIIHTIICLHFSFTLVALKFHAGETFHKIIPYSLVLMILKISKLKFYSVYRHKIWHMQMYKKMCINIHAYRRHTDTTTPHILNYTRVRNHSFLSQLFSLPIFCFSIFV